MPHTWKQNILGFTSRMSHRQCYYEWGKDVFISVVLASLCYYKVLCFHDFCPLSRHSFKKNLIIVSFRVNTTQWLCILTIWNCQRNGYLIVKEGYIFETFLSWEMMHYFTCQNQFRDCLYRGNIYTYICRVLYYFKYTYLTLVLFDAKIKSM